MMRRLLLATLIAILVVPSFFFFSQETGAVSDSAPFTPHEVKVLVVSPANTYYSGAHYLISDLARYGFNITHHASDDALATNYLADPKTSNLDQYDVVILHGILGFPPSSVSIEEINHFTNYGGILIVIGNALFRNETTGGWWEPPLSLFTSAPIQKIEQRLGVNFTGFMGEGGIWQNSGTFTLTNSSIKGLPSSLSYVTEHYGSISFQLDLTTNGASIVYDFNITSSPSTRLVGKTTGGVTYYRAENGAVGICVQGAYIYGVGSGTEISYYGLTDISKRSSLLASLIAFALNRDINTIIKPQPLATIRLDHLGGWGWTQTYLNTSLFNFNSVVNAYGIIPTLRFTASPDFPDYPEFWRTYNPEVLSQLQSNYRDWEYSSSLRGKNTSSMTKSEIETLIHDIKGNYTSLGIDLFSTITTVHGYWGQATLEAMANENLTLINLVGEPTDLAKYYPDWWKLRIVSNVIVHNAVPMVGEFVENFTQISRDSLHYRYFSRRDKWALSAVHGFLGFAYSIPNFRWNEVGRYSLRTVYENLTSEIPDIRFVPLMEAGLYFGNNWARVKNSVRVGSVIEFDIDTSAIPNVTSIEKGMLWLRINANESIQEVSIDDNPWFYFDDHAIRMPAPANSSHVKVTLGASPSPRLVETKYKVVEARYDGYRFYASISSAQGLNFSGILFLPQVGPFQGDNWSVFCPEARWSYKFDSKSSILKLWAISDGFVTFEVGVFWSVERTPPWYNSSVTITVNITDLQTGIREVTLSYYVSGWVNITMRLEDGLWVAAIPKMPYGTVVQYRVFISDNVGNWLITGIFSYSVIDKTPPEVGVPTWDPPSPFAGQSVHVKVSVTEPENASDVGKVMLYYYLDRIYVAGKLVNMTSEDGFWLAVIPGQSAGKNVSFFVIAYDKMGNVNRTLHYSYTVGGVLPTLPFPVVFVGVGLAVGVGVGIILYFVKFRKTRHAN